jgi:hypothetical protein
VIANRFLPGIKNEMLKKGGNWKLDSVNQNHLSTAVQEILDMLENNELEIFEFKFLAQSMDVWPGDVTFLLCNWKCELY